MKHVDHSTLILGLSLPFFTTLQRFSDPHIQMLCLLTFPIYMKSCFVGKNHTVKIVIVRQTDRQTDSHHQCAEEFLQQMLLDEGDHPV